MGRFVAAPALVLATAALFVACGTTDEDATSEVDPGTTAEEEQPLSPAEERGRDLFVENCGSCHTLDAAGTDGQIGPSLDEAQVDEGEALAKIEEGPGAMPENLVTGQDAQEVAAFVAASGP